MTDFYKFLADVSSGYWWVTVVLVGILINLASAYIKPSLDRWYESYSAIAHAKRAKNSAMYNFEVRMLAANNGLFLAKGLEEMRWRLLMLAFTIFAFGILSATSFSKHSAVSASLTDSFAYGAVRALVVVCLVMGMWAHSRAGKASALVFGAGLFIRKLQLEKIHAAEGMTGNPQPNP